MSGTVIDDDAVILRTLRKVEIALHRAGTRVNTSTDPQTIFTILIQEIAQITKETEDANPR